MSRKYVSWVDSAKWWHFWNPGSSWAGGAILGLVFGIIVRVFFFS